MPFRALKRPLQFLGLFETSLCRLTHIPAYKVREGVGEGRNRGPWDKGVGWGPHGVCPGGRDGPGVWGAHRLASSGCF